MRESVIFLVLGAIIFAVAMKDTKPASYIGLFGGMLLFVGFSAVLAKFGYSRQSMKELRAAAAAKPQTPRPARGGRNATRPAAVTAAVRNKPAATRRTSTGPSQRPNRKKR
ncbi:MAG: hypothetical protein ABIR68_13295 [Ilumatobacteraceae bacterium]